MGLLSNLYDQVQNAVSLNNVLGTGGSGLRYPSNLASGKIERSNITNIPNYADGSWRDSRGYAFQVVRVKPGGLPEDADGWQEFRLQINPQELTQDEIFAIEVTPTLRGVVVEHHGAVLKDINISGTTGISPFRAEGGLQASTGKPRLGAKSSTSGFEEFHELRSYFRTYVEEKRIDQRENGELRMIFKNYKDQEFLFVEPQKFTMKRSASRAMLYDYMIALKAVGTAVGSDSSENEGLALLRSIDEVIEKVSNVLETATGVINGSVAIIARVERGITDTLLNPLRQISAALEAIAGGKEQLLGHYGITRRFIDATNAEVKRVNDNLADAFGVHLDLSGYNKLSDRVSTLTGSAGRKPTYQEQTVLNSMQKINGALNLLASQRDLFDENVFQSGARAVESFGNKITLQAPNTVRAVDIFTTDTIQTIAAREMGDVDQFRAIVILNNLKPPYIAETASPGVLAPGSKILLPQQASSGDTGIMQNKIYNIQKDLSEMERALGVDIQLDGDGDIAISNVGDASLIAGLPNFGQAIATKLLLEIGSLKRHPGIGTALGIGRKVTTNMLNDLQTQILSSLQQDPRVESVPFIQIAQESGTTIINMLVKATKIAQPVPIPLSLNVS